MSHVKRSVTQLASYTSNATTFGLRAES